VVFGTGKLRRAMARRSISTVNGELYRLDTRRDAIAALGHFLPKVEYDSGERIDQLYGITLSIGEKKIYGLPQRHRSKDATLYAYEIATGAVTPVGAVESGIYTGSNVRDSRGTLYMGRFGDAERWDWRLAEPMPTQEGPTGAL